MKPQRQFRQLHHAAAKGLRQFVAFFYGAVGNGDGARFFGVEVVDAEFNHFASAHKQHLGLAQVVKDLTRQAHGCCGHADGVRTNFGGRAHLFGH